MSYTGKAIDLSKFDKQKEVELSSERVELGVIQDILKDYKKAVDTYTSAISAIDRVAEEFEAIEKRQSSIQKQAKQLGVDLPKETTNLFSRISSFAKEARQKAKK